LGENCFITTIINIIKKVREIQEKNWYKNYHLWPYHSRFHWSILLCFSVIVISAVFIFKFQSDIEIQEGSVLGTTTLYATVNAGSLSLSNTATATLSATTVSESAGSATGSTGTITVTDNRGSGAGWSVVSTSSDFTCCSPTRTIAVTNLTINPNNATLAGVSGASTTSVTAGSSHTFTTTSDSTSVVTAASGYGMGQYTINPSVTLTIPVGVYAGTYTATLTITAS